MPRSSVPLFTASAVALSRGRDTTVSWYLQAAAMPCDPNWPIGMPAFSAAVFCMAVERDCQGSVCAVELPLGCHHGKFILVTQSRKDHPCSAVMGVSSLKRGHRKIILVARSSEDHPCDAVTYQARRSAAQSPALNTIPPLSSLVRQATNHFLVTVRWWQCGWPPSPTPSRSLALSTTRSLLSA